MLGVVFTVVGLFSVRAAWHHQAHPTLPPPAAQKVVPFANGPWGHLESEEIALDESDQVFADRAQRLQPPRWVFNNYSREQLTGLLQSCQLSESESTFLLDASHWETLSNGFAISPPDQLVLGLSTASRQRLYWSLATNSANYPQYMPFNFLSSGIDDRFADSGLGPDKIELLHKLAYPGFGCLWLAVDRPLLQCFTANELQSFLRILYSYPARLLRIQVTPDSDIDALVQYWGKGREKKLRPLLESLAASPGGKAMGVGGLLPPFARERLYTFPDPDSADAVERDDCFFTAMNFFNDQPDQRFLDPAYTRKVLQTSYMTVPAADKFGDVIVLVDSAGNGIHACVYVADDFVFTKDGAGMDQPWVIMKLADVLASYPSDGHQRIAFWRRKDPEQNRTVLP